MDMEAMRGHLSECSRAYAKAGPMVKSQVAPFMGPLLMLLGGLVDAMEAAKVEREHVVAALALAGQGGDHGE